MKIIKWVIIVIILGGLFWWGADTVSPRLSVNSVNPQHTYGDTITFRTNIINFSPRPKEIYISEGDNLGASLLIDDNAPVKAVPRELAAETIPLSAFYNKTIEHTVTLAQATGDKKPQKLSPADNVLVVTPGKHSVRAVWGDHVSGEYTFGVR